MLLHGNYLPPQAERVGAFYYFRRNVSYNWGGS